MQKSDLKGEVHEAVNLDLKLSSIVTPLCRIIVGVLRVIGTI